MVPRKVIKDLVIQRITVEASRIAATLDISEGEMNFIDGADVQCIAWERAKEELSASDFNTALNIVDEITGSLEEEIIIQLRKKGHTRREAIGRREVLESYRKVYDNITECDGALSSAYVCKKCDKPSPQGVGFVDCAPTITHALASIVRDSCKCGYSQLATE